MNEDLMEKIPTAKSQKIVVLGRLPKLGGHRLLLLLLLLFLRC